MYFNPPVLALVLSSGWGESLVQDSIFTGTDTHIATAQPYILMSSGLLALRQAAPDPLPIGVSDLLCSHYVL